MDEQSVRRIETKNLKRELFFQKNRSAKFEEEYEDLKIRLKGLSTTVKGISNAISKTEKDIFHGQQVSDQRRQQKLRVLKNSFPLNPDSFNKIKILNETGTSIPVGRCRYKTQGFLFISPAFSIITPNALRFQLSL